MKFSSENLKFSSAQARLIFFKIRALWDIGPAPLQSSNPCHEPGAFGEKNPRAHKNKIGTSPPPQNPPLKRGILWTWVFLQKERIFPNPSENPFPRTLPRTFSEPFSERWVAVRPLRRAPYQTLVSGVFFKTFRGFRVLGSVDGRGDGGHRGWGNRRAWREEILPMPEIEAPFLHLFFFLGTRKST